MKEESESPTHGTRPIKKYLKSTFGSVSYCVVILKTTPHWSVGMTSTNFRLLTWEQQIKITFAAWGELIYYHFRSTLKRDDFFAYVYVLNVTVLSGYVSL